MKSTNKNKIVALAALLGAAGAATYTFITTYRSIRRLDNIELDFKNDSVLNSIFKKD